MAPAAVDHLFLRVRGEFSVGQVEPAAVASGSIRISTTSLSLPNENRSVCSVMVVPGRLLDLLFQDFVKPIEACVPRGLPPRRPLDKVVEGFGV